MATLFRAAKGALSALADGIHAAPGLAPHIAHAVSGDERCFMASSATKDSSRHAARA